MPASCPASSCWRAWCDRLLLSRRAPELQAEQQAGHWHQAVAGAAHWPPPGVLPFCFRWLWPGGSPAVLPSGSHAGLAFWASSLHGRAAPDMCLLLTLLPISAVEA